VNAFECVDLNNDGDMDIAATGSRDIVWHENIDYLSIEESIKNQTANFKLYPNPAQTILHFERLEPAYEEKLIIEIYDSMLKSLPV
jgi:hypothetical protein